MSNIYLCEYIFQDYTCYINKYVICDTIYMLVYANTRTSI